MFPSFNCDNSLESLIKKSYFPSDQNPSSRQDDPPFLFNFPSPFLDEHESPLNQIFFQNLQMGANPHPSGHQIHNINTQDPPKKDAASKRNIVNSKLVGKEADREIPSGIAAPLRRRNLGVIPRRRTGKKDRHSKICTAQGVRDRRMRLSLQVARKFFDLQDMLGYDKASKTIEWLFTKSKKAIKELISDHTQGNNISFSTTDVKSESFLSECEVVSGLDENTSNKDVNESIKVPAATTPLCISTSVKDEGKVAAKSNARESREKARARARIRTREKMMVKSLEYSSQWYKPNPTDDHEHIQKVGSSSNSPPEGLDQESNLNNQENISPYNESDYNSLQQQLADVGTIEKFLWNSSSSSTSGPTSENCSAAVSGYIDPSSNFMGFFGNWDLSNYDRASSIFPVSNQVSLAGNPNSVYSEFP